MKKNPQKSSNGTALTLKKPAPHSPLPVSRIKAGKASSSPQRPKATKDCVTDEKECSSHWDTKTVVAKDKSKHKNSHNEVVAKDQTKHKNQHNVLGAKDETKHKKQHHGLKVKDEAKQKNSHNEVKAKDDSKHKNSHGEPMAKDEAKHKNEHAMLRAKDETKQKNQHHGLTAKDETKQKNQHNLLRAQDEAKPKKQQHGPEVKDELIHNKQHRGIESTTTIVQKSCEPSLHQNQGESKTLNKGVEVKKKHKKKRKSKTSDNSAEHHKTKRPKLDSCINAGGEIAGDVGRTMDRRNVASALLERAEAATNHESTSNIIHVECIDITDLGDDVEDTHSNCRKGTMSATKTTSDAAIEHPDPLDEKEELARMLLTSQKQLLQLQLKTKEQQLEQLRNRLQEKQLAGGQKPQQQRPSQPAPLSTIGNNLVWSAPGTTAGKRLEEQGSGEFRSNLRNAVQQHQAKVREQRERLKAVLARRRQRTAVVGNANANGNSNASKPQPASLPELSGQNKPELYE